MYLMEQNLLSMLELKKKTLNLYYFVLEFTKRLLGK
jgi:hypothetical protein